ncbi:hypothetical protein HMPREF3212_03497 [Citrobacter freundii]|nr:hypothetical protein HMPREF3212_03497 [Citrobacter freundii]
MLFFTTRFLCAELNVCFFATPLMTQTWHMEKTFSRQWIVQHA